MSYSKGFYASTPPCHTLSLQIISLNQLENADLLDLFFKLLYSQPLPPMSKVDQYIDFLATEVAGLPPKSVIGEISRPCPHKHGRRLRQGQAASECLAMAQADASSRTAPVASTATAEAAATPGTVQGVPMLLPPQVAT